MEYVSYSLGLTLILTINGNKTTILYWTALPLHISHNTIISMLDNNNLSLYKNLIKL